VAIAALYRYIIAEFELIAIVSQYTISTKCCQIVAIT